MVIDKELCETLTTESAKKMSPHELYDFITGVAADYDSQFKTLLDELEYGHRSAQCTWKRLGDIEKIDEAYAAAQVVTGGSEGVYLDVWLVIDEYGRSKTNIPLFVFKHLDASPDVYVRLGALGGILTHLLELFLWVNYL